MSPSSAADHNPTMNAIAAERHMRACLTPQQQQHQQLHQQLQHQQSLSCSTSNNNHDFNNNDSTTTQSIANSNNPMGQSNNNGIAGGNSKTSNNSSSTYSSSHKNSIGCNGKTTTNHKSSSLNSASSRREKLSVVIPAEQKSLMTPTVCLGDTAATHHQMYGLSLALSSQEIANCLFTGLPSCTPTSADKLPLPTHINPFFWRASEQAGPSAVEPIQSHNLLGDHNRTGSLEEHGMSNSHGDNSNNHNNNSNINININISSANNSNNNCGRNGRNTSSNNIHLMDGYSGQPSQGLMFGSYPMWPYSPEADRLIRSYHQQQQQFVNQLGLNNRNHLHQQHQQHHNLSPTSMMSNSTSASSTSTIGGLQQQQHHHQNQINFARVAAAAEAAAIGRSSLSNYSNNDNINILNFNDTRNNPPSDASNNHNDNNDGYNNHKFINGCNDDKETNLSNATPTATPATNEPSAASQAAASEANTKVADSDTIRDQRQQQKSQASQLSLGEQAQHQAPPIENGSNNGVSSNRSDFGRTTPPAPAVNHLPSTAQRAPASATPHDEQHETNYTSTISLAQQHQQMRILGTSKNVNPIKAPALAPAVTQITQITPITTLTTSSRYHNSCTSSTSRDNNNLNATTNLSYVCGQSSQFTDAATTTSIAGLISVAGHEQSRQLEQQHHQRQHLLQSSHLDQHDVSSIGNNFQSLTTSTSLVEGDKRLSSAEATPRPAPLEATIPVINAHRNHNHHSQQQQQQLIYGQQTQQFRQFYPIAESHRNQNNRQLERQHQDQHQQLEQQQAQVCGPTAATAFVIANPAYTFAMPNGVGEQFYIATQPANSSSQPAVTQQENQINQSVNCEQLYQHKQAASLPTIRIEPTTQQARGNKQLGIDSLASSNCAPSGSSAPPTQAVIKQDTQSQQQQHKFLKNTQYQQVTTSKSRNTNSKDSTSSQKRAAKQQPGPSAAAASLGLKQQQEAGDVPKKKSKGGRKKKLVTAEELVARKTRSKERNRVAAKRCRQKRKVFFGELNSQIEKLQEENKTLKDKLGTLSRHHEMCDIGLKI